jgi:hypothetical protein
MVPIKALSDDLNPAIRELLRMPLCPSDGPLLRPVAFIERKAPDLKGLQAVLQASADSNRWTNFGPVSRLLEQALERLLGLPPSRAVVMCSSGTAALFGLVGMKQYLTGKTMRWAASGYSYRCSQLGPLSGSAVLDCDDCGLLSLDALGKIDPDAYDGVVFTNVFGFATDIRDYVAFCQSRGKELIVDNAAVLEGFPRTDLSCSADEIISLHQTKPWGMGEGGCVIIDRKDVPVFRGLINLGSNLTDAAFPWASNSKISDFSCAILLQRLMQAPEWRPAYQAQARRILDIAIDAGLRPLTPMDLTLFTPSHLPMLADRPISDLDLANQTFVMRKYYRPLSDSNQNAWAIYNHIVNIPCHPDMAILRDEEIRQRLSALAR